jgi:polyphosphate glucokinase
MSAETHAVGVDFGGSGIKGAPVDIERGEFSADRVRIPTPEHATPENVADVVDELFDELDLDKSLPVGITIPGVVRRGVVGSAANIDSSWIDADADALFTEKLDRPVTVVNDADAAGLAEARYGAARDCDGLVVVTTLGTGIGTALIHRGVLIPNSELGHIEVDGHDAETRAANSAREREELSWEDWAERLTAYYAMVEKLLSPDLFVVGGGVSKKADKFIGRIGVVTPLVAAELRNTAGIVGAALLASEAHED